MRRWLVGLTLIGLSACGGRRPSTSASHTSSAAPSSSESLPAELGIGRLATSAEISGEDIDVMPDGTGLPPGSGSVGAGDKIYQARCASCHGAPGQGTAQGPTLVGRRPGDAFDFAKSIKLEGAKTIGDYWPYATTVFSYVRKAMPYDHPGSLSNDQVYAVTAWLLWKNRIVGRDAVMDAKSLPAVRMPARNRFVPDDRLSSKSVR